MKFLKNAKKYEILNIQIQNALNAKHHIIILLQMLLFYIRSNIKRLTPFCLEQRNWTVWILV